jgi:hypothetical protein
MKWSELISENIIFSDGVYPHGFEAILSVLSRVFILDMYPIIRFFGLLSIITRCVREFAQNCKDSTKKDAG